MIIYGKNHGIIHEYIYEDIIVEGDEFKKSAEILFSHWAVSKTFPPEILTFPALTCYSFACELYFKGILKKRNNQFKHTHKLTELFKELPNDLKDELTNTFDDFENELSSVDNLFERSRYFFDTQRYGKDNFNIEFIIKLSETLYGLAHNEITITYK